MIQILSYNSFGKLRIAISGEPYDYFGVSPSVREDVERRSKYGQVGKIMELLETFSRPELFEEEGGQDMSGADMENGPKREEISGVAAGKIAHLEGEVDRLTKQRNEANQFLADSKESEARLSRMLKTAQGQIQILEEQRVTPKPSVDVVQEIDDVIEASEQEGGGKVE